jgi:hypothetical protein
MLHPSLSARSFPPVAPGECYTTYRGSGKELLVIGSSITALLPAVMPPLIYRCSGTRITGPIKRHIRLCIRATNYAHSLCILLSLDKNLGFSGGYFSIFRSCKGTFCGIYFKEHAITAWATFF